MEYVMKHSGPIFASVALGAACGFVIATYALMAHAAELKVVQQDLAFAPNQISLKVGDRIIFANNDEYGHNVYSPTPGSEFDVGLQEPGQSRPVEFKTAGVVEVRCRIHPRMRLVVTVGS